MFSEYYKKGICVIPLKDGYPQIKWAKFYEQDYRPDTELLSSWDSIKKPELALLCGKESGIIALDIDIDDPKKVAVLKQVFKPACIKVGSKGATFFFKYNGEPYQTFKKDGKTICEILSDKHLTTLPPSKHREKKDVFYVWQEKPLLEANLTELLPNYNDLIRSILLIPAQQEDEHEFTNNYKYSYEKTPEFDDAEKLLIDYCSPDCSREEWIIIGSALKSSFGDAAYQLFDDWSSRGKTYKRQEMRGVWKSFKTNINYGAIVNIAKQGGFRREAPTYVAKTISQEDYTRQKLSHKAIAETSKLEPEIYETAPPLVKEIADWIVKNSEYPQPFLALGAAVATVGFVLGKKYSFSGVKANMYIACLAESGEGKEWVRRCCFGLIKKLGYIKNYETHWTSGTAIERGLEKKDGLLYFISDELGLMMRTLTGKFQDKNQSDASKVLLSLYTSANTTYKGKLYADQKENPQVEIDEPFCQMCGFSNPQTFFESITSAQAFEGLLGRLTTFKGADELPKANDDIDRNAFKYPPEDIIAKLNVIKNKQPKTTRDGSYISQNIEADVTPEAAIMIKNYRDEIDIRRRKSKSEGENLHLLLNRSTEQLKKLCLIASSGNIVDEKCVKWAMAVNEYNIGLMCYAGENLIADNDFDRKCMKAILFIRKAGGIIDKSEFCNLLRGTKKERDEVILNLLDQEKIEIVKGEGTGKGKRKEYYQIKTSQDI